jgi:hypothetical protein
MRHNLGRVVATAAVAAAVPHHQITALIDRHAAGDWGEISEEDRAANDGAARTGYGRLFSSYSTSEHGKLWVITDDIRGEGEGPITTVMSRGLLSRGLDSGGTAQLEAPGTTGASRSWCHPPNTTAPAQRRDRIQQRSGASRASDW